ncbi:MAG: aminomethyl-transferring glycine dehydrogenase subunit GcvPB [Coriobacteriia bacterium]|nr:aminomethyl-transferring glycine dehydrogenase subunit GcvPB [Coriobacteriia bacterium]
MSDFCRDQGPRPTLYESSRPGARCLRPPACDSAGISAAALFGAYARTSPPALPQVSELEIMRHYDHLARMNFGVDTGSYPLGSCTMKYNPRINEVAARLPGFAQLHPAQPDSTVQGALRLMYELQEDLAAASGLPGVSLQPAAGAHGEYTALMVFRAALTATGNPRKKVILPDTAHGTNPASVAMAGYDVVTVPSTEGGLVDMEALRAALDKDTAAFMLTNPNTVGIFDPQILEITRAVHEVGAFAYCDGANLNAILGITRPGDLGFDALHINLHKTFSTPHGGGGPGAGPLCVSAALAPYLPGPVAARNSEGTYERMTPSASIGRVRAALGNFAVFVRAYTYIKALGAEGLKGVAEQAVLSANYLRVCLQDSFPVAYDRICMHEFVLSGARLKAETGVSTLDIAKRLLDYGFHPPTIYFPLIVNEAMMFEPTETEPLAALDALADALKTMAEEAKTDPELLKSAPHTTPVRRLDEAQAARNPNLRVVHRFCS